MEQQLNPVGVLRVYRVEEGKTSHVRTLSEGYVGLFTHYVKRRSLLCRGDQCDQATHKLDRVWKGYAAVERWEADIGKWLPCVLEISESLELDLRGRWRRGQIWEFFRDLPIQGKKQPITGKLQEEHDPAKMPPAFDFKPVLMHLYHTQALPLGALNPMPPRIIVQASDGEGPAILVSEGAGKPAVDPQVQRRFEEWKRTGKFTPTEKKQERGY